MPWIQDWSSCFYLYLRLYRLSTTANCLPVKQAVILVVTMDTVIEQSPRFMKISSPGHRFWSILRKQRMAAGIYLRLRICKLYFVMSKYLNLDLVVLRRRLHRSHLIEINYSPKAAIHLHRTTMVSSIKALDFGACMCIFFSPLFFHLLLQNPTSLYSRLSP